MSEPEIEGRHGFPGALRAWGGVGGHFGAPHVDDAAIRTRALTKRYGKIEAVRGIELDVGRGEIFGLIGPDGAGKTSTFQILGGVMPATEGEAIMLGHSARDARSYVGYLTQVFSLYHDLTVAENLRYMGELRRLSDEEIERRGRRYLEKFGMDRFMNRTSRDIAVHVARSLEKFGMDRFMNRLAGKKISLFNWLKSLDV